MFEDTKVVIKGRKSKKTDNGQMKRTTNDLKKKKTLHRILKIE